MTFQRLTKITLAFVFSFTVSWVLLVGLAFSPELQAQTFSLTTTPVEGNSDDVLAVDLNHDFLPDLGLLDRAGRVVSTYLNQGSGTFSLSFSYPIPDTPVSLDAIDNDERPHRLRSDFCGAQGASRGNNDASAYLCPFSASFATLTAHDRGMPSSLRRTAHCWPNCPNPQIRTAPPEDNEGSLNALLGSNDTELLPR
jgi:hypothetical protein